jgi:Pyruvate/2-oxoacid:ferredoxin oxidoreductase delta subunit
MFRINSTTITGILLSIEDKLVSEMRRKKTNKPPQITCVLKFTDEESDFKKIVERRERDLKIKAMLAERESDINQMIRLREENERRARNEVIKVAKISERLKKIKVRTTKAEGKQVVTIKNKITDKCAILLKRCEEEGMINHNDARAIIAHAKTVSTYETKLQDVTKEVIEEERITSVEKSDAITTFSPVFTYDQGIKCSMCNTNLTDVCIQNKMISHMDNYKSVTQRYKHEADEMRITHLRRLCNNYSHQMDEHAMFLVDNLDYDKVIKEEENDKLLLKEMERRLKQILGVDNSTQT